MQRSLDVLPSVVGRCGQLWLLREVTHQQQHRGEHNGEA